MYQVLITEDEDLIRRGFAALIPWEKYGFSIAATAENGYRALDMMKKQYFHLVVTDVRMPRMDGLELIRTMREKDIDSEVIILSGYRNFEYARTAIKYGVCDYLLKPISTDELIKALQSIRFRLNQKTAQQQEQISENGEPIGEICTQISGYVEKHYSEEISLSKLANKFHYNETYLGRLFLKRTGMTFRNYLNKVRMAEAARLLSAGHMVSDTAQQVGYQDLNYFSRIFKAFYGVPPSQYYKRK